MLFIWILLLAYGRQQKKQNDDADKKEKDVGKGIAMCFNFQ